MKPRLVPTRHPAFYQGIPKVDLHRHLEGSLRLETLIEVGRSHGLEISSTGHLRSMVQVNEEEPFTFQNFLSKFEILRLFYRSPEVISRITREAIEDADKDNVRYMELRFTPVALSKAQGFSLAAVMDWVCEGVRQAEEDTGIQARLIASVNRHESLELAEQVAWLASERRSSGIIGIDLAGNEAQFPALPFAPIFREARQSGLRITVHGGEWGGAENVADAILALEAERIGHGVRVLEDANVVALARERGTIFEVCITSNYQSGVVAPQDEHPIARMLAEGLNVTINTDDPSVSQIRLSDEYKRACEKVGFSFDVLQACVMAAAQASFLPEDEHHALQRSMQIAWQAWEQGG
ncbi:MAG: adenosine deaminase [Chloroflexota bacterium]